MKDAIATLVSERQHVTFPELERSIENFSGEVSMTFEGDSNLILWPALSETSYQALSELLLEKRIFFHPSSKISHLIEGIFPKLPEAHRRPKGGYKEPHWLPVCFCDFPFELKGSDNLNSKKPGKKIS